MSFLPGRGHTPSGQATEPHCMSRELSDPIPDASACPGVLGACRSTVQGHSRGAEPERERSPSILSSGRSRSPSQREPHGCRRMMNGQLTEVICPPLDTSAQLLRRGADTHRGGCQRGRGLAEPPGAQHTGVPIGQNAVRKMGGGSIRAEEAGRGRPCAPPAAGRLPREAPGTEREKLLPSTTCEAPIPTLNRAHE